MKLNPIVWPVGLLVILSGCAATPWSNEAKQLAYRDAFNSVVHALATAVEAGVFSPDESRQIFEYAQIGQQILDRMDAALELDQPTTELVRQLNLVLRELVAYRMMAERRTAKTQ